MDEKRHQHDKNAFLVRFNSKGRALVLIGSESNLSSCEALTKAENAVAQLAAQGLSNKEIASRRSASVSTVANQLSVIYAKLGIASREELALQMIGRPAE